MSIPQEIKELFTQNSVPKRYRIKFPNGERPDIVAEKIEAESVRINESICTKDDFKFGLCESTIFEASVHDIEEGGNRGNIKGLDIEVVLEVDISSLPAEFIREHGKTANDVPFPYYEIPKGRYTVETCKKTVNSDERKIVAYDRLNSSVFGTNLMPWIRQCNADKVSWEGILYNGGSVSMTESPEITLPVSAQLADVLYGALSFMGIPINANETQLNTGEVKKINIANGWELSTTLKKAVSNVYKEGKNYDKTALEVTGYLKGTETITIPDGKFVVALEFDENVIAEMNTVLNGLQETNFTVAERVEWLTTLPILIGERKNVMGSKYTFDPSETIITYAIFDSSGGRTGQVAFPGIIEVKNQYYGTEHGTFDILKGIKVIQIESIPALADFDMEIDFGYDAENDFLANIPEADFTLRNVASAILEMSCTFGKINSEGAFEVRTLGQPLWELSSEWTLSDEWVLNYSTDSRIPQGEEEEGWYDEDYESGLYGSVKISGENNETIARYVGNPDGMKTYNITSNVLLNNSLFGAIDIQKILKRMWEGMQAVRFTPMQIVTPHAPHMETGDRIILSDKGKEVSTYIFNRISSGVVSIYDEIDTTNIEQ
ncbi:MAG: hypothetical protein IJZ23_06850 [Roseburia sp.]|nr:hypothetical protein [Roseburia sp.]MBQ8279543.1 hypothetical protein [Roseburia sp.]